MLAVYYGTLGVEVAEVRVGRLTAGEFRGTIPPVQGWLFLYDLISLILGGAAGVIVLILYLKTRSPRLILYLVVNVLVSLIVAVLVFDQYSDLAGLETSLRPLVWSLIDFLCCGLAAVLPRMSRARLPRSAARIVERCFAALAAGLAVLLAIQDFFVHNSALYMTAYIGTYSLLSLALLYFGICHLPRNGVRRAGEPALRHYRRFLSILGALSLLLLPAFVAVDFFGWIILPFGLAIPRDLSLLPAFLILMSLGIVVTAAMEILEPSQVLGPIVLDASSIGRHGFTKREAEVLPLLLQCLTYKEIGEQLFISPGTVRTHVIHIYQKTGAGGRLELARILKEGGPTGSA